MKQIHVRRFPCLHPCLCVLSIFKLSVTFFSFRNHRRWILLLCHKELTWLIFTYRYYYFLLKYSHVLSTFSSALLGRTMCVYMSPDPAPAPAHNSLCTIVSVSGEQHSAGQSYTSQSGPPVLLVLPAPTGGGCPSISHIL